MSTRDEQPVTVPPPAGEDDAYSATTKVGAMPADIMEKLRAEGLLPEDVEKEELAKAAERETPVASMRPSTSLEKRTPPLSTPPSDGKVPALYSMPPAAPVDEAEVPPSKMSTAKPPPPVADAIETPVAFAFPPTAQVPPMGEPAQHDVHSEERADTTALTAMTQQKKAARAPSKVVMAVVAVLVVVFLVVALMRLRG